MRLIAPPGQTWCSVLVETIFETSLIILLAKCFTPEPKQEGIPAPTITGQAQFIIRHPENQSDRFSTVCREHVQRFCGSEGLQKTGLHARWA
jgi:hypothetical protein